jgi:dynein heavy chain
LENTLKGDIIAYWEDAEFEIKTLKGVDAPCQLGGNILDIQEKLEDHLNQLNGMNAQKFVTPFKQEVTDRIFLYSDVVDTIDKWLKVQTLWTNLVSVFTSGDIAKNLPTEAKLFKQVDKIWLKNMERAYETKNVVQCCQNELLKSSLSAMQTDLEKCQRQLESYLEAKRGIFPRFYFCSNADLLKILSQGSDPNAVQDDFEKMFDAINNVTFDEDDPKLIIEIKNIFTGTEYESVMLDDPVRAEGQIEDWLNRLEKEMQKSMRKICQNAAQECFSMPLREYTDNNISQVALLGIQFVWTNRLQEALSKGKKQEKQNDLDKKKKENDNVSKELTAMCLDPTITKKMVRCKIETMVTIQVYQRDKFDEIMMMVKQDKIKDENDFDWLKNTRCYWKIEEATVGIAITDVEFIYQYEYLGAKERLCITPLTDRCYVTLAQALGMNYGGAPAGPAGTGKTETVKDLGRTLGIFVVVTNCSDEHRFRDMAKIFKGVCQSGLWGCFDEFNRISLPTLSVVAAQVESITQGKKQKLTKFWFPGEPEKIRLVHACAYFITMNPGYAGRQELPENLKVLFRGVTMMVPNRQIIMMVKLASVGYDKNKPLSIKFDILYKLCEQQLSKQRHYDFGLRNILSVLRTAGNSKRREPPSYDEETIVARTLRDMNLSKFVAQDIPLF